MKDWKWHDSDRVRPLKFFVPSGETTEERKGWTLRRRGDSEGQVLHSYRCPVHGVFDAMVSRAEVPDAVRCPEGPGSCDAEEAGLNIQLMAQGLEVEDVCGDFSPWAGSRCGIGHAAGEVMS